MKTSILASAAVVCAASIAQAQIPAREFAARRDSLAKRIDSGVVISFGGRTPVTDFGAFYQLPAFHYLTAFDEPDAGFLMVVRGGRGVSTLFLTPVSPRRAFYYGRRPDSSTVVTQLGMRARSFDAMAAVADSLASSGLPFFYLADFADADFAGIADEGGEVHFESGTAAYACFSLDAQQSTGDDIRSVSNFQARATQGSIEF